MPDNRDQLARAAAAIHRLTCQADKPEHCDGATSRDFDLTSAALSGIGVTGGAALIAAERRRQRDGEGYTAEHDAGHVHGEFARAAAVYAIHDVPDSWSVRTAAESCWPSFWQFKPDADPVRNLTKAGALIAAEIDRLLAAEGASDA